MKIIDGKKLKDKILSEVKEEISKLSFQPIFCDVLVGEDPASIQYVKIKAKAAEAIRIKFHSANFPISITTNELIKEIKTLNKLKNICGIVVQLPLPASINRQKVLDSIDPRLDVDCLGTVASEKFYKNDTHDKIYLGFPTALACMALLDSINIDLKNKKIVVLGQGMLVGKPVTALLRFKNLSPVVLANDTEDKEKFIKEADIIISGMGDGKYIKGDMIKSEAVIIDAGTSEFNSGIVGDVDLQSVENIASYVSPVPGGVGPVTVAMLLNNVLKVAKGLENF